MSVMMSNDNELDDKGVQCVRAFVEGAAAPHQQNKLRIMTS